MNKRGMVKQTGMNVEENQSGRKTTFEIRDLFRTP